MITLFSPRVWEEITSTAIACTKPAQVAVAYFGSQGDRLLPLRKGSSLVVDASISTLAAGATCPSALERLRSKGVNIYSAECLHAKVYAFDNVAFVGSANVSDRSARVLIEAVVRVHTKATISSVRAFVQSLCLTRLSASDLAELGSYYRQPRPLARRPRQNSYSTLLMELTNEQGGGRETQVQPPVGVWEAYFGLRPDRERLPTFTLVNESRDRVSRVQRRVVKHDHNYTIELPGAELPRPAILRMRRIGRNEYSYRVHRPSEKDFAALDGLLRTVHNPLWQSGRRWILV